MANEYRKGQIIRHRSHECIIVDVWNDEGKDGVTIKPVGNYGFEVDVDVETLEALGEYAEA